MLDRIAAMLSSVVYTNPNPMYIDDGYGNLEGWKFLEASKYEKAQGYFGAAFQANNTIIITHRGTEITSLQDLGNDLSILLNRPLTQLPFALNFSKFIEDKYTTAFNYLHTGHSLGGLLAEVVGLSLERPVISFEAPGSYEVVASILGDPAKIKPDNITAYFATPNVINTCGKHIANKFYKADYYTEPKGTSIFDYILYSIKQHSIVNLVNQFDTTTNKLKDYTILSSWPEGLTAGYENYLNDESLWAKKVKDDWEENIIIESLPDPMDIWSFTEIKLREEYQSIKEYQNVINIQRETAKNNIDSSILVKFEKHILDMSLVTNTLLDEASNNINKNNSIASQTSIIPNEQYITDEEVLPCCDLLFSSVECEFC